MPNIILPCGNVGLNSSGGEQLRYYIGERNNQKSSEWAFLADRFKKKVPLNQNRIYKVIMHIWRRYQNVLTRKHSPSPIACFLMHPRFQTAVHALNFEGGK